MINVCKHCTKCMVMLNLVLYVLPFISIFLLISDSHEQVLPMVINTWPVPNATKAAWKSLMQNSSAVDAVVAGCGECEAEQCRHAVGAGGSPDESGETTLDAMIMDGKTMDVGAVACLRRVKTAIAVAKAVMTYTDHTLLVGNLATNFAVEMGFTETNLSTRYSIGMWKDWKNAKCQPNFRENVSPKSDCGPYTPDPPRSVKISQHSLRKHTRSRDKSGMDNHDTIGMIAIDTDGNISAGTSTNGLTYKIPGRVGDSPIMGAGAYAENGVGASVATGNGDIMMRFLPTFNAVLQMSLGRDPDMALHIAMKPIIHHYPDFRGAMLAVNKQGQYGAICHGYPFWTFCLANPQFEDVTMKNITCI